MSLDQCLEQLQILQDNSWLKMDTIWEILLSVSIAAVLIDLCRMADWDKGLLISAAVYVVISLLAIVQMILCPIEIKFWVSSDDVLLPQVLQYFTLESAVTEVDNRYIYQISPKAEFYREVLEFEGTLNTNLVDLMHAAC